MYTIDEAMPEPNDDDSNIENISLPCIILGRDGCVWMAYWDGEIWKNANHGEMWFQKDYVKCWYYLPRFSF